jgi:hypothetical protein
VCAAYDDAVSSLYRVARGEFVAERKRLSGALKASGDREAAARVSKLARPTISAWAVNQLWWRARVDFDELLSSAAELRAGHIEATRRHREALGRLHARAAGVLIEAGHAAADATLRRVITTLQALAATGGFDPDAPGALVADRDAPGFEAMGMEWQGATAPRLDVPPALAVEPERARGERPEDEASRSEDAEVEPERQRAGEAEGPLRARERAEAPGRAERERVEGAEHARAERGRAERQRGGESAWSGSAWSGSARNESVPVPSVPRAGSSSRAP